MLTNTVPETFSDKIPTNLTILGPGRCFLKVDTADYDTVSRGGTWYVYASTSRLQEMLTGAEPRRQVKMAVLFHTRITRPLVGCLLVLLGVIDHPVEPEPARDPECRSVPDYWCRILRVRIGMQGARRHGLHLATTGGLASGNDLRPGCRRLVRCSPHVERSSEIRAILPLTPRSPTLSPLPCYAGNPRHGGMAGLVWTPVRKEYAMRRFTRGAAALILGSALSAAAAAQAPGTPPGMPPGAPQHHRPRFRLRHLPRLRSSRPWPR